MKKVIDKIEDVGGVIAEFDQKENEIEATLNALGTMYECALPNAYLWMVKQYGAFSFKEEVEVECIDINPVADSNNQVSVDHFFSFAGKDAILIVLKRFADQLPKHLLPICEGEPGDLICISLREMDCGKVFYWYHESNPEDSLFLVSNDFMSFFLKLKKIVVDNDVSSNAENVKVGEFEVTSKFLELLRKSGYQPE